MKTNKANGLTMQLRPDKKMKHASQFDFCSKNMNKIRIAKFQTQPGLNVIKFDESDSRNMRKNLIIRHKTQPKTSMNTSVFSAAQQNKNSIYILDLSSQFKERLSVCLSTKKQNRKSTNISPNKSSEKFMNQLRRKQETRSKKLVSRMYDESFRKLQQNLAEKWKLALENSHNNKEDFLQFFRSINYKPLKSKLKKRIVIQQ